MLDVNTLCDPLQAITSCWLNELYFGKVFNKHLIMASSIVHVKFIACYEASSHGIWLLNFVTRLQIVVDKDQ